MDWRKMLARLGRVLSVAVATATVAFAACAAESQPRITGTYSDLRSSKETNDLDGTEIIVVLGDTKLGSAAFSVFYQFWEGGQGPLVVVPASIKGNEISFAVPTVEGECDAYKGIISARGV